MQRHVDDARAPIEEARRIMQICNACRYCEGLCSVFPAMTGYRSFADADLMYLANLCHDCRGCYYHCQYAEPHAFNVHVPRTFAEVRAETWQRYAWPRVLAGAFARNGLVLVLLIALSLTGVFATAGLYQDADVFFSIHAGGDFYAVIPHTVMVAVAAPIFAFALFAMAVSVVRYWRDLHSPDLTLAATGAGLGDALTLTNLSGGGYGCNDASERPSQARRYFHYATFYGFLACFAATSLGTIYHYAFAWHAPYGYASLPVLFGTAGGIALCIGTGGLYWIKLRSGARVGAQRLRGMETAFLALLFLTSLSGLALLALRETWLLGTMLSLHLGFVLAFFLSLPYCKMVHGAYRLAALVRWRTTAKAGGEGTA